MWVQPEMVCLIFVLRRSRFQGQMIKKLTSDMWSPSGQRFGSSYVSITCFNNVESVIHKLLSGALLMTTLSYYSNSINIYCPVHSAAVTM